MRLFLPIQSLHIQALPVTNDASTLAITPTSVLPDAGLPAKPRQAPRRLMMVMVSIDLGITRYYNVKHLNHLLACQ